MPLKAAAFLLRFKRSTDVRLPLDNCSGKHTASAGEDDMLPKIGIDGTDERYVGYKRFTIANTTLISKVETDRANEAL